MKYLKILFSIVCISLCLFFSVTCYASDISVEIDGKNIEFDVQPVLQNDRTLVPMRKTFEELGCEVEWLEESQTVIATKNSLIMALQIGKNIIILNDVEKGEMKVVEMDTVPILLDDRTLIPVRAVSECLGYKVDWIDATQTVIITTTDVKDIS